MHEFPCGSHARSIIKCPVHPFPFNQAIFKLALAGAGLPTAPFLVSGGDQTSRHTATAEASPGGTPDSPTSGATTFDITSSEFLRAFGAYEGPFIVKPVNGRASQYVEYVEHVTGIPDKVAYVEEKTNGGEKNTPSDSGHLDTHQNIKISTLKSTHFTCLLCVFYTGSSILSMPHPRTSRSCHGRGIPAR